jgi:FKBP-type peptidyl-prolyl cis-trans isomerase
MPNVPPMPSPDAAEWVAQASGLEIWDAKVGDGDPVPPGATVTVHYTGWLTNGKEFDSSVRRGSPRSAGTRWSARGARCCRTPCRW